MKKLAILMLVGVVCAGLANAQVITLEDNNSTAIIDTASSNGNFSWVTDGTNNLFQQWFWYRVGSTGPEMSIDTLPLTWVNPTGNDPDPGNEQLTLRYENTDFRIDLTYTLSGGLPGSGVSDIAETITISNLTSSALDFHFFQYADFDLNGTPGSEYVELVNANAFRQVDGLTNSWVSETIVTPAASHYEAGVFPITLNKLQDGFTDTLNDVTSAAGDVTWAFQWDWTLAGYDTKIISKDKHLEIVPEPATLALLGLGGFLLRRKK